MRSWYPVPKRIVTVVFAGVSKLLPSTKLIDVDVKFAMRGFWIVPGIGGRVTGWDELVS